MSERKSTIEIIKSGEGLAIEFKRTIDSPFKIAKTISSFANTSGGILLVGVGNSGELLGVTSELTELQKLERAAGQLIETPVLLRFYTELLDGKKVIRIEVDESADKPHYAVNEKNERIIYVRMKDKSVPIPKLLIQGEPDADTEKLLASRHVKSLISYLKATDSVTAKAFSRIINISEKRAERMLNDLAVKQILLKLNKSKPEAFSLKWTK
ncbi:AlbA family DNA-binding domain-containing protein [Dyadobacter psychrotolerans]|uniref:ATP-binding protein n=1 Tax=Dyadobacter psychrotolerans TaxID=2541721 RepID=A0A4R5DSU2_9BACT|nr:ATP-binding protein [Dyadobacter psychrotolerans]TDE17429.1 ATP-binding protein [Dyadobacter psychrotolerans]